jgi:predicted chitinase
MANVTYTLQSPLDLESIKECFSKESQHQNIKLIIDACLDAGINLQNQIAYVLATAKGESNFKSVQENFAYTKSGLQSTFGKTRFSDEWIAKNLTFKKNSSGKELVVTDDWDAVANRAYSDRNGNGDEASGDGYKYRGIGFVQLTGKANYEKFGNLIGEDLLSNPDRVLDSDVAAKVLAYGMVNGTFTSKKLSDYLTLEQEDYTNARQIINGTFKASTYAAYATDYESIIQKCLGQDVAFVIDTTGSMEDDIDSVKASATTIINSLFDSSPSSRVAVVGYNDPGTNTFLSFTNQTDVNDRKSAAVNAINDISVGGGGDIPEAVNAGLIRALSGGAGEWRKEVGTRRIILFGDAPPKDTELRSQVLELANNIDVSLPNNLRSFSIPSNIETQKVSDNIVVQNFTVSAETTEAVSVEFPVQIFTIVIGNDVETTTDFSDLAAKTGGKALKANDAEAIVSVLLEAIDPSTQSPVAVEDSIVTDSRTIAKIDLLANDSDPNDDPLEIIAIEDEPVILGQQITLSSGALVTFNTDGSISYNPNGQFDFLGQDTATDNFTYTISDGTGRISSTIVSIEITEANVIPSLTKIADDIFSISGGTAGKPKLQITISDSISRSVNDFAVFTVDDAQGRINGIAPTETGYTQAALSRAKNVFSAISNIPQGFDPKSLSRSLEFNSGDNLRFLLIKNDTLDNVRKKNVSSPNILFSNDTTQKITDSGTGNFTLAWEDGNGNSSDFKDFVVNIQPTDTLLPLGANLQDQQQGEVLDLTSVDPTKIVQANFVVNREAAFNNFVGFYKIADTQGTITDPLTGVSLKPGDAGYTEAAIKNRIAGIDLQAVNQSTATVNGVFQGGSIFAPFIVVNGSPDQLLDTNKSNDPSVYFAYLGANSDGVDHIRLLGNNTFGFEDLPSGGDLDYNDIIIRANLSVV